MLRRTVSVLHSAPVRNKQELGAVKYYWYLAKDGMVHLYHGFRLFGVNTKVAVQLARRLQKGEVLTRRERSLLETATADLLRLIPFSFFVIVPFAELLLPVALKMFPGLIPSTFETETQGRNKAFANARSQARAKQRLLEFGTTQVLSRVTPDPKQQQHLELFARAHRGDAIPASMIRDVAPLFAPEGPMAMAKLPPEIVVSLGKVSGVWKRYMWVAPNFLIAGHIKFLMERRWAKLQRDDKMLEKEGFGDLTRLELEKACQMRGMRWVDNSDALADQLQGWVDLSVNAAIPYHTLFFVKPTANNLADSIRSCPVDARRKLLGMQRLPREVQDALDRICDNVEPKDAETLEQSESTIALARRVEKIERDVMKSSTVDDLEVKRAIAEHFATEAVRDNCWKSIQDKYNGKVTVSTAVECVASAIHQSTHSVSNVFDGFEMGEGGKELAPTAFAALIARCRDDVAAAQEAQKAKPAADQHGHPAEDKKKK